MSSRHTAVTALLFSSTACTSLVIPPPDLGETPELGESFGAAPAIALSTTDGSPTLGTPFSEGATYDLTRVFGTSPTHDDEELYHALDFVVDENTELRAPRSGYAIKCEEDQGGSTGTWCHGLGRTLALVDYEADVGVTLSHMNEIDSSIADGDFVYEGQYIGLSGGRGDSADDGTTTGPHLHLGVLGPAPETNDFWTGQTTTDWNLRTAYSSVSAGSAFSYGDSVTLCPPIEASDIIASAESLWYENRSAGVEADELPDIGSMSTPLFSAALEDTWALHYYSESFALVINRRQQCSGGSADQLGFPWVAWYGYSDTLGDVWLPTSPGSFSLGDAIAAAADSKGYSPVPDEAGWQDIDVEWAGGWGIWTGDGTGVLCWRHRWLRAYPWIVRFVQWNGSEWEYTSDYMTLDF